MGAKNSKNQPGEARGGRKGSKVADETIVMSLEQDMSFEDEVITTRRDDSAGQTHVTPIDTMDPPSPTKASKVQEIFDTSRASASSRIAEGAAVVTRISPELDLSSSEDSDAEDTGGGIRKRKLKKKKPKKKDKPKPVASSPVKLNELRVPKKAAEQQSKMHFEQITDAYALAEFKSKERDDMEQDKSPPKEASSPTVTSRIFGTGLDMWKKPATPSARKPSPQLSIQPNRQNSSSSRSSTPSPTKKNSWKESIPFNRASPKKHVEKMEDLRIDEFDHESSHSLVEEDGSDPMLTEDRSPTASENNVNEVDLELEQSTRSAVAAASGLQSSSPSAADDTERDESTCSTLKPEEIPLHIDDLDEFIMDNILAETSTTITSP